MHWPDGKQLALWINLTLEHFPLNPAGEGFKPHGSIEMPYPDLRHYTLRDYGNRVGVFRVLDGLEKYGLRASAVLVAHGWNMDSVHHGGLSPERKSDYIQRTLNALAPYAEGLIRGWLSAARSQSENTPELLRQKGLAWFADWVNDELPYPFQTAHGPLTALPLSLELEDPFIVGENLHAEAEYADQMVDACEFLLEEAQRSGQGRLLALNIHPWVMGQPHRIRHLERVFAHLAGRAGLIWNAAPSQIIAASC